MTEQPAVTGRPSGPAEGIAVQPDRWLVKVPRRGGDPLPLCAFYATPTAEIRQELGLADDTDEVLGCEHPQGEGPLYYFVPVEGGAVRVRVCVHHADLLSTYHPGRPDRQTLAEGIQAAMAAAHRKTLHRPYDDVPPYDAPDVYGGYDYAEIAARLQAIGWTPPPAE